MAPLCEDRIELTAVYPIRPVSPTLIDRALLTEPKTQPSVDTMLLRRKQRLVVTCRKSTNVELGNSFRKLSLLPFSEAELTKFIDLHCAANNEKPDALHDFLEANPYIHEVCKSPLTASIMVGIHIRGGDLPQSRADLYDRRWRLLLSEWDDARSVCRPTVGNESAKEKLLCHLAYCMQTRHVAEIEKELAKDLCEKKFTQAMLGASVPDLFDDLISHHGLLVERDDNAITFGHHSHQEFFCAKYMMVRQLVDELSGHFGDSWWKNVQIFFVGLTGDADLLLEAVQRNDLLLGNDSFVKELTNEGLFSGDFSRFALESSMELDDGWKG